MADEMRSHTVSWKQLDEKCGNHDSMERPSHCQQPGDGWVVDVSRGPTRMVLAYVCERHADPTVSRHKRLGVDTPVFIRGYVWKDFARVLDVEWRFTAETIGAGV